MLACACAEPTVEAEKSEAAVAGAAVAAAEVPSDAVGELRPDLACLEADRDAALAHLVAAGVVRASFSLGESGARWDSALDRLRRTQLACLKAASAKATDPMAPARALKAALLQDVSLPRQERGGVPKLPWRLLDDGAWRATRAMPLVDAALAEGRLDDAHAALADAQRARLRDLPEVERFLDEADRGELLGDPVWIRWLGVRP